MEQSLAWHCCIHREQQPEVVLAGLADKIFQAVWVDGAIEHQGVHADGLQVIQPLGDAFQVAGPDTARILESRILESRILESRRVDAVKNSAVPPAFGRNAGTGPTRTREHLG